MIFMPKSDGSIPCAKQCGFVTKDVFKWIEHSNLEYSWAIRLDKRFSFDMYDFLFILNDLLQHNETDEAIKHVQQAAVLLINAANDEMAAFVEESVVRQEMPHMMSEITDILKKETE
jgi:hypothetical protein